MSTGLAPGLARKVSKTLDIKVESQEILAALTTLSSFYDENTAAQRRALKAGIERRGVALNEEYLSAAAQLIQALEQVQQDLEGLKHECQQSKSAVAQAKESTAGLLTETERLHQELGANEKRTELVDKFLQQYQLTQAEKDALQAHAVDDQFFRALDRVRSIHNNCKALLRTHHQRAGLELMDSMSLYQEAAYEQLCRWVQGEVRSMGDDDAPEVGPLLQAACTALQERPVLFKYCARETATARHTALFQRFITAVTRGGPGGMPRPIEMHAHDPRRYLGDMLAWVHQSLASERELLVALFGDDASREAQLSASLAEGSTPRSPEKRGEKEWVYADLPRTGALLERIFESVCQPLKTRIEQVLIASPPLLLCFSLSQLLGFYTNLIDRLLGNDASLTKVLASCRQLAARVFQEQLKAAGEKLLRYLPAPPKDLSTPQPVLEAVQQLAEIVTSFEASYEGAEGQDAEEEFAPVMASALDPILEAVKRSSQTLSPSSSSRLDESARDPALQQEYTVNCLSAVEQVLSAHSCCNTRAKELQSKILSHLTTLVRSHTSRVLVQSGLAEIVERMRIYESGKAGSDSAMAQDPALALPRVSAALKAYISQLSEPHAQPEFRNIQVPRMRTIAISQVATTLANAYEFVYENVSNPASGYQEEPQVEAALKHPPEEIRTVLGLV